MVSVLCEFYCDLLGHKTEKGVGTSGAVKRLMSGVNLLLSTNSMCLKVPTN